MSISNGYFLRHLASSFSRQSPHFLPGQISPYSLLTYQLLEKLQTAALDYFSQVMQLGTEGANYTHTESGSLAQDRAGQGEGRTGA